MGLRLVPREGAAELPPLSVLQALERLMPAVSWPGMVQLLRLLQPLQGSATLALAEALERAAAAVSVMDPPTRSPHSS